ATATAPSRPGGTRRRTARSAAPGSRPRRSDRLTTKSRASTRTLPRAFLYLFDEGHGWRRCDEGFSDPRTRPAPAARVGLAVARRCFAVVPAHTPTAPRSTA